MGCWHWGAIGRGTACCAPTPLRGLGLALGWDAAAGHDADVFAIAPGGDGGDLADSVAVVQDFHSVDGVDQGGVGVQAYGLEVLWTDQKSCRRRGRPMGILAIANKIRDTYAWQ